MKQHFSSKYLAPEGIYELVADTSEGVMILREVVIYIEGQNDEITRACINRIVDNLNKLAEHNAKNGGTNEV